MESIKKYIKQFERVQLFRLLVALLLFWTPVILFSKIAGEILEHEPVLFDTQILYWIHNFSTPFLDALFVCVTTIAGPIYLMFITIAILAFLLYKKKRLNALLVFFGVGGATAANFILKLIFHRDRPALWHRLVVETDFSFPSGHSMISMALIASVIIMLWNTRWRLTSLIVGTFVLLMIGASRLYLGVHYPTDVVAGWSIGLAWVIIVLFIVRKLSIRKRISPNLTKK
ncbi:MAG: phosphatase PAP2 family protein [Candidatus Saccharimonadales bacterium]